MTFNLLDEPDAKICGNGNTSLKINEACLDVISTFSVPLQLYTKSVECYKCDLIGQKQTLEPNSTTSFIVSTKYATELHLFNDNESQCNEMYHFEDFGYYVWNTKSKSCHNITITDEPEKFWINIGVALTIYVTLAFGYFIFKNVQTSRWYQSCSGNVQFQELEADLGNPENRDKNRALAQARTRRLSRMSSVDVFRGIAITLMIFVNYGGGGYSSLKHAPWNGLTIADMVFPWFIWIMGVSISLSLRSQLRTSAKKITVFWRIAKRTAILISLGIILNSGKNDDVLNLRIPGVLQRIGITYFLVASFELIFTKPQRNQEVGSWYRCPDIFDSWIQWILISFLTSAQLLLTLWLPVPGCPTGYLGPGGLHEHSAFKNCTGGAAGYIDRLIFTPQHIYSHPTCHQVYHTNMPYDPEGLLGTLTSVLCAFLGVHAGRIVLCYENTHSRIKRWIFWALVTGITAGVLCNWSQNEGIIPVNKNLWSLSYVLATSSISYIMITVLYWLIDFKRYWNGVPFLYAGMNSIALYIGHTMMNKQLPWRWTPVTNSHAELLGMDLTATTLWLIISFFLYRNNMFISL